ncbi:MAG: hypothetical protein Harvfovirus6_31 [Harvfovirus sp.]|uniref:Uncharacterized protein n=1 Tax=Harvfovirus sp. TaxID=2487768 RepID=A0A3G5A3K9_9VIRU|nr:MAG: hypothetical protein Harvfovirus6_31 [Harvfovirus sp.]
MELHRLADLQRCWGVEQIIEWQKEHQPMMRGFLNIVAISYSLKRNWGGGDGNQ